MVGAESGLLTTDRLQPLNCDFSPLVEGWNDWGLKPCGCSGQNPGCAVCPSSWGDINRLLQGGPTQTEYSAPESIRELVGLFSMSSRGTRDLKAVVTLIPLCSVGGQGCGEGCRVFGVLLSLLGIFIAAMDGVPFTLHPRFEGKSCGPLVSQCPWDGESSPASVHEDVTFLLPHDPAQ